MSIISEVLASIGNLILAIISSFGYVGLFVLMVLESMVVPVPSEFVMPFAGFLVSQGQFGFFQIVLCSSLGSISGSLLSYYIGKRWGYRLIISYGKFFFVDVNDLRKTETWFTKRGELTIFISRLVPVIRHLISLVAGVGKMNVKKFSFYTIMGATIWNTFLAYLGYLLGQHWHEVTKYAEGLSFVIVVLLLVGCFYFIYRHLIRKKSSIKEKNNSVE